MRCGKKLAEEREYCGDCMHREHKYDRARTLYEYRDVAPSIYRFKYSGRQEYGDFFGEEMARLLGDFIGRVRPDVIVPVPLYRGKLRKEDITRQHVWQGLWAEAWNCRWMRNW